MKTARDSGLPAVAGSQSVDFSASAIVRTWLLIMSVMTTSCCGFTAGMVSSAMSGENFKTVMLAAWKAGEFIITGSDDAVMMRSSVETVCQGSIPSAPPAW